jgi:hypothetical protein
MACERYRDALTDVAAGAPAAGAVEAHLATCETCRAELEALRRALAAADEELGGLAAAEPSPELAVRIRRAVADSEPSPAWRFGWLWPAAAAAATLLVALAVWVGRTPVLPRDSRPPGPEGSAIAAEAAAVPAGDAAAPGSAAPAARAEVRRAGGSLGTRPHGVPRDDAPEVLVPAGEAEALLRFAAHLQTRAVSPDSLLVADLSAPLPEPKGVEIQPLEIVPLDPAEASGTD